MGGGNTKVIPKEIPVYTHQRKVDGSLATAAEEERRKRIEEQMIERYKEIEQHNREMAEYDYGVQFFMDVEEQRVKRGRKYISKKATSKKPITKKETDKKSSSRKDTIKSSRSKKSDKDKPDKSKTSRSNSKAKPTKKDTTKKSTPKNHSTGKSVPKKSTKGGLKKKPGPEKKGAKKMRVNDKGDLVSHYSDNSGDDEYDYEYSPSGRIISTKKKDAAKKKGGKGVKKRAEDVANPYETGNRRDLGFGNIELEEYLRNWTKDQLNFFKMFSQNAVQQQNMTKKMPEQKKLSELFGASEIKKFQTIFDENEAHGQVGLQVFESFTALRTHPQFSDFVRVFKADLGGRGMDFEELVWMLSILHKNAEHDSRFQFQFKVFDCDEDNLVSKQDLQTIIYKLYGFAADGKKDRNVTSTGVQREDLRQKMDDYIQHLFDAYDTNQDNRVTDKEFVTMFEDELVQKAYTLCSVDFS